MTISENWGEGVISGWKEGLLVMSVAEGSWWGRRTYHSLFTYNNNGFRISFSLCLHASSKLRHILLTPSIYNDVRQGQGMGMLFLTAWQGVNNPKEGEKEACMLPSLFSLCPFWPIQASAMSCFLHAYYILLWARMRMWKAIILKWLKNWLL